MIDEEKNKYFSAEEARKVSKKTFEQKVYNEIDEIYKLINIAISNGKFYIKINKKLMLSTQIFLINTKGFKINNYCDKFEPTEETIISW